MTRIQELIQESVSVKNKMLQDAEVLEAISRVAERVIRSLRDGNKVLLCGNGGSAADAQHIAAELSGRFLMDRAPLFAEALHVNTSYLTAVANDYSYDEIYSRLIMAKGNEGDVLMGISTSGNSPNIVRAIKASKERGMVTLGLAGQSGGELRELCDHIIRVPSTSVPRVQEAHIMIGHIICELVETALFGQADT